MTRRNFSVSCLGALAAVSVAGSFALPSTVRGNEDSVNAGNECEPGKPHISFLLYDGMTALDLIGPAEVLAGANVCVDYVWRNKNVVYAESRANNRLGFLPTATFSDVAATDILCVPGTSNPYAQIIQEDMVEWVSNVGQKAAWVTSICTGSFILGAAGLLKGYKATAHWTVVDELSYFGAVPVRERVVHDRNRVTGAGVTSGIDFGLVLLSLLQGEEAAKTTQLMLEYDPCPPYNSGSPEKAESTLVSTARNRYAAYVQHTVPYAKESLYRAAQRLGVDGE